MPFPDMALAVLTTSAYFPPEGYFANLDADSLDAASARGSELSFLRLAPEWPGYRRVGEAHAGGLRP
jgi:hypothetical protein